MIFLLGSIHFFCVNLVCVHLLFFFLLGAARTHSFIWPSRFFLDLRVGGVQDPPVSWIPHPMREQITARASTRLAERSDNNLYQAPQTCWPVSLYVFKHLMIGFGPTLKIDLDYCCSRAPRTREKKQRARRSSQVWLYIHVRWSITQHSILIVSQKDASMRVLL